MSLKASTKDHVRLILTAIGIVSLGFVLLLGLGRFAPGIFRHHPNLKLIRFLVISVVFAGYCVKVYWKARKHLEFWAILTAVLALHFFGVGYFFFTGPGLSTLTLGVVGGLEMALLAVALYRVLGIAPSARTR
jgi:hypothetical protein